MPVITIREILVAALGLLVIPKDTNINIEDIVPQMKCFPVTSGVLDGETAQKLNNVSETIAEMAQSYNDSAKDVLNTKNPEEENKEIFIDDLVNNLEDLEDNLFYDDVVENEEVLNQIYECLLKDNEMTEKELVAILEKNEDCKILLFCIKYHTEDQGVDQHETDRLQYPPQPVQVRTCHLRLQFRFCRIDRVLIVLFRVF